MSKQFISFEQFKPEEVVFAFGNSKTTGKPTILCHYGPNCSEAAMVSPACVTNWPRVNGDGNYGTMWGPTDPLKAKYTLDLTDTPINGNTNPYFEQFSQLMAQIDDKLLDFVQANQLKILGRKNLTREEVKMLQIPTIRPKYDKVTAQLLGHTIQLNTPKYAYDGMGGKHARVINVCDHTGIVLPNGVVSPGDVVAATAYMNCVYSGVGGDKFGISWAFDSVQVICQRARLAKPTEIESFRQHNYEFGQPYEYEAPAQAPHEQFSEPMAVA